MSAAIKVLVGVVTGGASGRGCFAIKSGFEAYAEGAVVAGNIARVKWAACIQVRGISKDVLVRGISRVDRAPCVKVQKAVEVRLRRYHDAPRAGFAFTCLEQATATSAMVASGVRWAVCPCHSV